MSWVGTWRNQYGSVVEIADDADRKVVGKGLVLDLVWEFVGRAAPPLTRASARP